MGGGVGEEVEEEVGVCWGMGGGCPSTKPFNLRFICTSSVLYIAPEPVVEVSNNLLRYVEAMVQLYPRLSD